MRCRLSNGGLRMRSPKVSRGMERHDEREKKIDSPSEGGRGRCRLRQGSHAPAL